MNEIDILGKMPMVLTRDDDWIESINKEYRDGWDKPGRIVRLPDDAVLVEVPDVVLKEIEKIDIRKIIEGRVKSPR